MLKDTEARETRKPPGTTNLQVPLKCNGAPKVSDEASKKMLTSTVAPTMKTGQHYRSSTLTEPSSLHRVIDDSISKNTKESADQKRSSIRKLL